MSLEKKIATNLFTEYHNRIGHLTSYMNRTKSSRALTENIIAYGVMCLEIGKNMELDELKHYLEQRDHDRLAELAEAAKDAKQSAEDEHGVEKVLSSQP